MAPVQDWPLERYRALLHLLVRQCQFDPRLRRRFDSSDLVQETLLRAYARRDQFRGTTEPERIRWLQEILSHVLADEVRKAHARKRDVALEQSLQAGLAESSARLEAYLADGRPGPGQQAERHELLLRLADALEQLPEDQRRVVIQRDLLGDPVSRIAEDLGRTEKSVAGLLLRGRRALRDLFEGLG